MYFNIKQYFLILLNDVRPAKIINEVAMLLFGLRTSKVRLRIRVRVRVRFRITVTELFIL